MGYQTVIVIRNDEMGRIDKDPRAWWTAVRAKIAGVERGYANSSTQVVVVDHDSNFHLIEVGQGYGRVLADYFGGHRHVPWEESNLALLKEFANKLGYRISKKPKKQEDKP